MALAFDAPAEPWRRTGALATVLLHAAAVAALVLVMSRPAPVIAPVVISAEWLAAVPSGKVTAAPVATAEPAPEPEPPKPQPAAAPADPPRPAPPVQTAPPRPKRPAPAVTRQRPVLATSAPTPTTTAAAAEPAPPDVPPVAPALAAPSASAVPSASAATPTPTADPAPAARASEATGAAPKAAPASAAPAGATPVTPPGFGAAYLDNPAPVYPPLARRLGEQGKVLLRVLVRADGTPDEVAVRTSSGFARLDQAAVEAVRRWKFVPARRGSEPVAAWAAVPIRFSLGAD